VAGEHHRRIFREKPGERRGLNVDVKRLQVLRQYRQFHKIFKGEARARARLGLPQTMGSAT
jgi:hypothetical protein